MAKNKRRMMVDSWHDFDRIEIDKYTMEESENTLWKASAFQRLLSTTSFREFRL